jgi:energy-coupling factor transporter ATP-binding protein EcfA2
LLEVLQDWANGIEPSRNWAYREKDNHHAPVSETEDYNHPSRTILWLYGPAGSGKSAVAQSFCQRLQEQGRLGGSSFFKRGHPSRGNAKKLFPTIAYQLALLLPELRQLISHRIENDPAIVDRSLSQLDHRAMSEEFPFAATGHHH